MNGRDVSIQVNPGPVAQLVFGPVAGSFAAGTAFNPYAYAYDAYGNLTTCNDTVHFSSSDPNATLPPDETYPGNENELGTFILRTPGVQTITMTDVNNPSIFATITITVT
jgi:hypothetical protein